MFKKLENKIKELALRIHETGSNDLSSLYEESKQLYELTVLHKYLSNQHKDSEWILHEKKLKKTLQGLYLKTKKITSNPHNASEIIPLIDTIKDLVTEIPESDYDK